MRLAIIDSYGRSFSRSPSYLDLLREENVEFDFAQSAGEFFSFPVMEKYYQGVLIRSTNSCLDSISSWRKIVRANFPNIPIGFLTIMPDLSDKKAFGLLDDEILFDLYDARSIKKYFGEKKC